MLHFIWQLYMQDKSLELHFFHFLKIIFNWRIIALQCCVGFCCTAIQISHNYIYISSLLSLLPLSNPSPLGYHRVPSWAPFVTQQLRSSSPLYTIVYKDNATFSIHSTLFFLHCVHKSILSASPFPLCKQVHQYYFSRKIF